MWKTVLGLNEYTNALLFALRMWYYGKKSTHEWRRAGRRDLGKYINDHVTGKLAEIAFAKMLKECYGIGAEVDLEVRRGSHLMNETDIKTVEVEGVRRPPRLKLDVKGTGPRSKYLLIDAQEFKSRRYDVYVLVLVDLPRDHLLGFFADETKLPPDLRKFAESLRSRLAKIKAVVRGFAYREDIETRGRLYKAGEKLLDPQNPKKVLTTLKVDNYGLPITQLRDSEQEWRALISRL